MEIIKKEDLSLFMAQIDRKLSVVEVKGDSVENLFSARLMLKELFSMIEKKDGDD
jgi:hypothetical protein